MLKVACPNLAQHLLDNLEERRNNGDTWNSLQGSAQDRAIRKRLAEAFRSKCGYCEQAGAGTIDHFVPKGSPQSKGYQERCWSWNNFVWACDNCQRKKGDRPIEQGGRRMVSPREDEPLYFLMFSFRTGRVDPVAHSTEAKARGVLTIGLLGLDNRSWQDTERRRHLLDVLDYMGRIVEPSSLIDASRAWERLADHLRPEMPYLGIIRQLVLIENEYTPIVNRLRQLHPSFDHDIAVWCLPLENA